MSSPTIVRPAPLSGEVVVSADEAERRTIRRADLVSCNQAFIDCRTPGSDRKENYALIGSGVSQSSGQVINLQEPHGYNIGAAAMPHGVTNSLHMHFTAEVFLNFHGDWLFRWGPAGEHGEYLSHVGDVVTVPTWIFRGFTNAGPDDGWLFTALGRDDTGGILWGPTVLREAESHGLYLTAEGQLIDTVAGDTVPAGVELVTPMPQEQIDALRHVTPEEMRARVTTQDDLAWSAAPFLDAVLPGGGAELAAVIGPGLTEDRNQRPRVTDPHGFALAWLRAVPGAGMLAHRHDQTQVLIVRSGTWEVTLNRGADAQTVVLHERDTFSVPIGVWRALRNAGDGDGQVAVVTGGDGRVHLDWDADVRAAAEQAGVAHDANGFLAPAALVRR